MTEKQIAPYGSWKSPITTDLIVAGSIRLGEIAVDGSTVYWNESRPSDGGRNVVVCRTESGGTEDMTPAPYSVRTRVHEYGGGSYAVRDDAITFANFADQRLYQQLPGQEPTPVTPEENVRFADGVFAPDGRFVCVREDHRADGHEAANTLVALKLDGHDIGQVLVGENDFYSTPRFSPDGKRLVWLTWNHPNMPWDGTELWLADYNPDGTLTNKQLVAGGLDESIFQPEWSPDGILYFTSDRSGWWNLYRLLDNQVEAIYPLDAEFGAPQWGLGMRTYAFVDAGSILCCFRQDGRAYLARLDIQARQLSPLDIPFTAVFDPHVADGLAYFLGGSQESASGIVRLDLNTGTFDILRSSSSVSVAAGTLSVAQLIEFPTTGGLSAFAHYYAPQNEAYRGPADERPPLIVMSHGGPTGSATTTFNPEKQFWTSRGFAVLDVDYGGSTGYGRAYRKRLNGTWGVVDVQDCINAAAYLVEQGIVDGDQLAIRGGSAGGYTTLCALTFHDTFAAGASYFGLSDIEVMIKDTHKFEARYLDSLVGPYPERRDLYRDRSPIHFVDQINCPMILFQGLEDKVVLPNQAEMMFEAVKAKGLPVAYLPFAEEQHGFRKAENIKRSLEAELYFYAMVFGFELADEIDPVHIENL